MFDISVLKEMKLSELQDIAKKAKTIKFNGVKKEVLIAQILENQATATQENTPNQPEAAAEERPKRNRISAEKKPAISKKETKTLFSPEVSEPVAIVSEEAPEEVKATEPVAAKSPKAVKFKKADYDKRQPKGRKRKQFPNLSLMFNRK